MPECKHECDKCGEKWGCNFPTYSEHQHYEEVVELGYYCNSYCPNCDSKKRNNLDELFGDTSNTGYLKGLRHHQLLKNK